MDLKLYDELRGIIYDQSGIRLQDGKDAMVSTRIAERLRSLNIPDEEAYMDYLRRELDQEIVALLDVISTNVTSFFREAEHFEYIQQWMRTWLKEGKDRFRFWCAASSSGEEPYTIAMVLRGMLDKCPRPTDARILATDISTRVLLKAKAGVYSEKTLEPVPKAMRMRYFEPEPGGDGTTFKAKACLRDMLLFKRLNLSTPPFPMRSSMDVIICRNVMIYFDDPVRDALINAFHDHLRPGGYLIVGKSESLVRSAERFERAGPSIYRKGE